MAIIFTQSLSETELLNSHNNNEVKFYSDNVLVAESVNINFGSSSITRTPDPSGVFSFNTQKILKTLINDNEFKDTILPDYDVSGYVYEDTTLYKEVTFTFKITFAGGTTESTSKNFLFIKSIKQPIKFLDTVIDSSSQNIALLIPTEPKSKVSYAATYFEGYPFDIPLYSNAAATISLLNKTNGQTLDLDVVKGVNRIFVSQGDKNFTNEDDFILMSGINHIEIYIGAVLEVTLYLEKVESDCGPYLKYYNNSGGYSYYRFNSIYRENLKTRTLDVINSNYTTIKDTLGTSFITGKNSSTSLLMLAENLTDAQMRYLKDILTSPRVELYLEEQFSKVSSDSWLDVEINDGTNRIGDTKRKTNSLPITVSYDNYNLSL